MWIRTAVLLAICSCTVGAYADDMYGPASDSSASSAGAPGATGINDKKKKCQEEWRVYRESQACFARYRTVNGGVRPEAFRHCVEVKQPEFCE